MALVHDMAECIVGDIAPSDNVSKEEKHRREEARDQQPHGDVIKAEGDINLLLFSPLVLSFPSLRRQ